MSPVPFRAPPPFASARPHCTATYCINERGYKVVQLWQEFPALAPLYSRFEREAFASVDHPWYPCEAIHSWIREWLWVCIPIAALYLALIFGGQQWMRDRPAADLRRPLIAWNWLCAIFSLIGAARVLPHAVYRLATVPTLEYICQPGEYDYGTGAVILWMSFFTVSKVAELLDTMFIVARKKPLILLHWYHHVTVLLFTFHAFAYEQAPSIFYAAMNLSVHGVMYSYYAFSAMGYRGRANPIPSIALTSVQLSQMVVGVLVHCACFYLYYGHGNVYQGMQCGVSWENMWAGVLMYLSYLLLFGQLFYRKYMRGEGQRKALGVVTDADKAGDGIGRGSSAGGGGSDGGDYSGGTMGHLPAKRATAAATATTSEVRRRKTDAKAPAKLFEPS